MESCLLRDVMLRCALCCVHLRCDLTSLFANSFPFFTSSFGLMPLRNLASVMTGFLPAGTSTICCFRGVSLKKLLGALQMCYMLQSVIGNTARHVLSFLPIAAAEMEVECPSN